MSGGRKASPIIFDNLYNVDIVSLKDRITGAVDRGDTIWIRADTSGGRKSAAEILKAHAVAQAITRCGYDRGYTGNYPVHFSDGAMYFVCEPAVYEKTCADRL